MRNGVAAPAYSCPRVAYEPILALGEEASSASTQPGMWVM